jgi:ABC-type dipeptide/oligopeptide/nickel transport system permease subunit
MIQGVVLAATVVVLLTNLLVDLSYSLFNPRRGRRDRGRSDPGQPTAPPRRPIVESPGTVVRRFRRQRFGIVALAFLAYGRGRRPGAAITPDDPNTQVLRDRLQDPNSAHWLGTDDLGRDVLSRMLVSTRVSLLAAFEATLVSIVLGVPLGLVAGYIRGWTDALLSRVAEVIMAVPGLPVRDGHSRHPRTGHRERDDRHRRRERSPILPRQSVDARGEEVYILAAVATGGSSRWIIRSHILPNVLSPLIVQISLSMGFAILFEAALSFLGLGVQPPDASWGTMLGRSTQYMEQAPFLVIFPGLAILLTVLAFNVLGDAVNDALGRQGSP